MGMSPTIIVAEDPTSICFTSASATKPLGKLRQHAASRLLGEDRVWKKA
jgi:hypothetical protein